MLIKISLLIVSIILLGSTIIECRHIKKREIIKTFQTAPVEKQPHFGSPLKRYGRSTTEKKSSEDTSESVLLTSTEAINLMKLFGSMAYEADKGEFISGLVDAFADSDSNITLVGWQAILTPEGTPDHYRTIELVIPPKPEEDNVGNFAEDDESDEEEDKDDLANRMIPHNRVKMLRDILEPFRLMNLPASVYYASYYKNGEREGYMHLSKDELIVEVDGLGLYNKTMETTPENAEDIIERAKKVGRTTVLRYDKDGKLIEDKSSIDPLLIGNVIDYYEATDEMLIESPKIIAELFAIRHTTDNIMVELKNRFNKKFPDYKWNVIRDPENYYLTRDVTLSLSWDNMDFFEDTDTYFLVYGAKKE